MSLDLPVIGITMGDPAGIGPEIIVKSLSNKEINEQCNPVIIGNTEVIKSALKATEIDLQIHEITKPKDGVFDHGHINIINLNNVDSSSVQPGVVNKECGLASYEYIEYAAELAMKKEITAVATAPINKESLKSADVPYIGHTEMFGGLTNTEDPLTMFEVKNMRIFFLTRHISLREMVDQITKERVENYLSLCHEALNKIGIDNPKIAVAGLNPHCGENGLFGDEEVKEIQPGIEKAKEKGINAVGPLPADSVFHQALNGRFDAVLSLYHDQGHIAAKMTDFDLTVSVTHKLPFLRTSVDHGTAFDIAGSGKASSISMEESIKVAARYADTFQLS